ncbi:hypothetical protein [Robiginitalea sp. SC105]|uniref:hypothetical protein n=1 Tax=Robiginitalea sp. SC105 TaxID=2762332 RepID=UPI00163B1B85|nr:hypothetical protein [Robiginitalea sp. SC105]MBC2839277.1 hypothetical protein [Robiginitalea sp. SC105]
MQFQLNTTSFYWLIRSIRVGYLFYFIIVLFSIDSEELIIATVFSFIIIELTIIRFLKNWYRFKRPKLLDWFRLSTFVFLILNFLFLLFFLDQNSHLVLLEAVYVKSLTALPAIITILIGLLAIDCGEVLAKQFYSINSSKSTIRFGIRNRSFFYTSVILVGLVQIYLILNGIVGYKSDLEYNLSSFSFLIIIVDILGPLILLILSSLFFLYEYRTLLFKLSFAGFFLLEIIFGFLSGMKEQIIVPFLLVIIPFIMSGRQLNNVLITLGVIFVLFLYPINNNYRKELGEERSSGKITVFINAIERTFENGIAENFQSGTDSYQDRISLFPVLMYSIENEKDWNEYKYFNRYIYLPISWIIPRFLIPDKPVATIGGTLYKTSTGRQNRTSITPSTYGWAFFEGGYITTFMAFALFGFFISYLENNLTNRFLHRLIYITLLISLLKVESDIYFKIAEILQNIFIIFLIHRLMFRQKHLLNV